MKNNDTNSPRHGKVTLVGFGPGDPDLLTVKGERALRAADVVFYDDLTNADYLDSLSAEKIYVGKRCGHHHSEQDEINNLMLQSALDGKNVVRLKGGDPMLFAHGGEEVDFLRQHSVDVEVVPGVSTAFAAAASLQISLTRRKIASSVSFVNGHSSTPITPSTDTIVYYMGAARLAEISKSLIESGRSPDTPVLLVHNVSLKDEKVFTTTLQNMSGTYPTPLIVIVGEVCRTRE
ncbi:MAG: uroporphyrinogen-III C-methyltransferase [Bacteroidales bacterium]|nr:uroporphyrinogen-III C-methyltransferase [Bacteroidales bacterium]